MFWLVAYCFVIFYKTAKVIRPVCAEGDITKILHQLDFYKLIIFRARDVIYRPPSSFVDIREA